MNFHLLLLSILLLSGSLKAQQLEATWIKKIGNFHYQYSSELAMDKDGFLWALAYTDGPLNHLPHQGGTDCYLSKMDSEGLLIWEQSFGGLQDDQAQHLAIDAHNNCWVSGYFSDTLWIGDSILVSNGGTDAFLLKFDPNGKLALKQQLGGLGYDSGHHLAIQNNSIYWAGIYQNQLNLDIGTLEEFGLNDVFLLKLDTTGQHIWIKNWGCPSVEHIVGLSIDSLENVTAATLFKDVVYINSDTIWGSPSNNNLIVQFASTGQLNWQTSFDGIGQDLNINEHGNVYYTGYYDGSIQILGNTLQAWSEFDAFVLSLNSTGQLQWLSNIHGNDQVISNTIQWDKQQQQLYLSGLTQGTVYYGNDSLKSSTKSRHLDDDIFVLIYDVNGTPSLGQKFGGQQDDWVSSLIINPLHNNLYLYGSFLSR